MRLLALLAIFCVAVTSSALAEPAMPHVQAARMLILDVVPEYKDFFDSTNIEYVSGPLAPLARFQPRPDQKGAVAFGTDLKRYRDDYVIIASVVPRDIRPDFEQYLTVLTALSIANEKAHFDQHRAGSMDDFFDFKVRDKTDEMCGLYGLQQHISDVVMLDMALRLYFHFQQIESKRGMQAVSVALDKMGIAAFLPRYHQTLLTKSRGKVKETLSDLKQARKALNMASLPECNYNATAFLDQDIIDRASVPVRDTYLAPLQAKTESNVNE